MDTQKGNDDPPSQVVKKQEKTPYFWKIVRSDKDTSKRDMVHTSVDLCTLSCSRSLSPSSLERILFQQKGREHRTQKSTSPQVTYTRGISLQVTKKPIPTTRLFVSFFALYLDWKKSHSLPGLFLLLLLFSLTSTVCVLVTIDSSSKKKDEKRKWTERVISLGDRQQQQRLREKTGKQMTFLSHLFLPD